LATLPERERAIVVLRFFGNLTQTQIADRVGLSQMHVSRLLAASITKLRTAMTAPEGLQDDQG
jgi:RNA polymerase sigma-B factor